MSESRSHSMLRSKRTLLLVIALLATLYYFAQRVSSSPFAPAGGAQCNDDAPRVTVRNGTLCGVHSDGYRQDFYLGVPYAKPPLDGRRFRRAQSRDSSFREVRSATQYPRHCVGYGDDRDKYPCSEDCLYLNIVRPRKHKRPHKNDFDNLPVAVWFHGGALVMGGTADLRYNLSFMVKEGVNIHKPFIGISVNYRLSGWGFLAGKEMLDKGETNMGILDQRMALHWIRENIAAFGGDPNKVTIWGQSAGATSVGLHLTAYGGRDDNLFHGAVLESGGTIFNRRSQPIEHYEKQYQDLLKKTSCQNKSDTLKCLQKISFSKLDNIFKNKPRIWRPIVDNDFIRSYDSNQVDTGQFVKVPILAGANTDEATIFTPKGISSPERFETMVENYFKSDLVSKVLDAYPDDPCFGAPDLGCKKLGRPYGAQFRRIAAFDGDLMFIAHRRLMCETWAEAGVAAYCYRFNARSAGVPEEIGVPHIAEVAFVFSNVDGLGFDPPQTPPFQDKGPEYTDLAHFMSQSWASFFTDLNPNTFRNRLPDSQKNIPDWPAYEDSNSLFLFEVASQEEEDSVCCAVEEDSFRKEGIDLIIQNNEDVGS